MDVEDENISGAEDEMGGISGTDLDLSGDSLENESEELEIDPLDSDSDSETLGGGDGVLVVEGDEDTDYSLDIIIN